MQKNSFENGYNNLIYVDSKKLDLRDQIQVKNFFKKYKPNVVINAAARVGVNTCKFYISLSVSIR